MQLGSYPTFIYALHEAHNSSQKLALNIPDVLHTAAAVYITKTPIDAPKQCKAGDRSRYQKRQDRTVQQSDR